MSDFLILILCWLILTGTVIILGYAADNEESRNHDQEK